MKKKILLFLSIMMLMMPFSTPIFAAGEVSQTIPVIYINTENAAPVLDKETYVKATYYIDPMKSDFEAVGSVDEPLPLQIKGRGNFTWIGFDKKPYKLKLDKKAKLLGMAKNKHYTLLAHADDTFGYLKNEVGFNLSRRFGLEWTPGAQPVEFVMNGEYMGLYFLTEQIKIDENRVNIVEQNDLATDPEEITGGWLVEIDNYDTDPHVEITEGNWARIVFTYKSPEILSPEQEKYLTDQMKQLNAAIYDNDKSTWDKLGKYLDLESTAKFYMCQEILDDTESYHGSCYLYKDRGDNTTWHFGPVWDFGNAYMRQNSEKFIYVDPSFNQTWIGEIAKFKPFQNRVRELWAEFLKDEATLYDDIDNFITYIQDASAQNDKRWEKYQAGNLNDRKESFLRHFKKKMIWLGQQFDNAYEPPVPVYDVYLRGNFNNWGLDTKFQHLKGYEYEIPSISFDGQFKIATQDWYTIDLGINEAKDPIKIGESYFAVAHGGNFTTPEPLVNTKIYVNVETGEVFIGERQSGITKVSDNDIFSISGRHLSADNELKVYSVDGCLVAHGNEITLPSSGLFIVVSEKRAVKIAVR